MCYSQQLESSLTPSLQSGPELISANQYNALHLFIKGKIDKNQAEDNVSITNNSTAGTASNK